MVDEEIICGMNNIMGKEIDAFTSLASAVTVQQCRLTQLKNQCELMNANIRGVDSELQDNIREYKTLKNETEDIYHQAKLIQKNIDSLKESRQAVNNVLYEIHKQVSTKKCEIQEDKLEQESILKKYTDIYNEYLEVYESFPLAKEKHTLEVKLKATDIQSAQVKLRLKEIFKKSRMIATIKKNQHQQLIVKLAEKYIAQKNILDMRRSITEQIRLIKKKIESLTQEKKKALEATDIGETKNSKNIRNRMDSLSLFFNKIRTSVEPKEIVCNTTSQIQKLELPHLTVDSTPLRKVSLNYDWSALFGKSNSLTRSTAKGMSDRNQPSEQPIVLEENSITEKTVKTQVEQTSNQYHIYREVEYLKEKVDRESNKNDSLLKSAQLSNKRKLSNVSREISRKDNLDENETEQKMKTMKVAQQQAYTVQPSKSITTRKKNYVESVMDTLQKKQPGVDILQKTQLTQEKPVLTTYSLNSLISDINSKRNIAMFSHNKNINKEDTSILNSSKEKNISLHQISISSNICPLTSESKLDKQKHISQEQIVANINEKARNNNNSQDIFSQSEINDLEDSNDSHNMNESYIGMSPLTPDVVPSPCSIADVCSNQPTSQVRVANKLDSSDNHHVQPQFHEEYCYPMKGPNSRNKNCSSNEQTGMNIQSKYFHTSAEERNEGNHPSPSPVDQDVNEYSNIYSPQDYQDYEENYLSLNQVFSPPEATVGNEDLSEYNVMQLTGTRLTNSGDQKIASASTDNKISSNFSFNFTTGPSKSKIFSLF